MTKYRRAVDDGADAVLIVQPLQTRPEPVLHIIDFARRRVSVAVVVDAGGVAAFVGPIVLPQPWMFPEMPPHGVLLGRRLCRHAVGHWSGAAIEKIARIRVDLPVNLIGGEETSAHFPESIPMAKPIPGILMQTAVPQFTTIIEGF